MPESEEEIKIHAYEDKLTRKEAWKELLESKYRHRIAYLDYIKWFKMKILVDIRYEEAK